MLAPDFRPLLRPRLRARPLPGGRYVLGDVEPLVVTVAGVTLAQRFDGRRTLAQLAAETGVPLEQLTAVAEAFDAACILDGPTLAARLAAPVRMPSCVGCYPPEPEAMRERFARLFTDPGGPGAPGKPGQSHDLRAVMAPHMDYERGGVTYGHAFKELFERTAARLFVIVATSHYSPARFTLTRQDFSTPLGVAPTDRDAVDFLAARCGPSVIADRFAHLAEHSIELEVALLQYLYPDPGAFRVVPLLVGSFHDCVESGDDPMSRPEIAAMVAALRELEASRSEPICYLISGDLAHIGPKFGDPEPVSDAQLAVSKGRDEAILAPLVAADGEGFFREIASEGDARRICGLPPAWVALAAARPKAGTLLHYGRSVADDRNESVSFAAVGFTS